MTESLTTSGAIDIEKLAIAIHRFEEEGTIDILQEALLIHGRIYAVLANTTSADFERPPNIDFSRFDRFLHSLEIEADKQWENVNQGTTWRRIPKQYAAALKQAILEFEKQLELRRFIPKSSNTTFWGVFRSLRDQMMRGIINIETIKTVIRHIPNNVVWSGYSSDVSSPKGTKADFAPDDPISPFLPDGTPLPENYEDFLKLLERDASLLKCYRHKFFGYAKQARRKGDWNSVFLFIREVMKHRHDDIEVLMIFAQAIEQVGNRIDLQIAITTLEKVEVLAQRSDNQGRIRDARKLRQLIRGKLSIIQAGLPPHYSEVGHDLLKRCGSRAALIYYVKQAREDQNYARAALFSSQLVKRYGGNALDLRYLAMDLEQIGLYTATGKVLERLVRIDPNEVDQFLVERLNSGMPRSYLDVTPEIFGKCVERDLVVFAGQARKAGDFTSAIRFQKRLTELFPENIETLMRLAGDFYHAGDLASSINVHEQIATLIEEPEAKRTTYIIIQEFRRKLGLIA